MTEIPRETRVLDAVVSLVDSLLDDFDVVDLLTELTEQCAQLLDVAAAGLLLATPRRQLQLMAATSEKIHHLELFQLQADQGPCLDCYATGQPISVADMQTDAARWPRFACLLVDWSLSNSPTTRPPGSAGWSWPRRHAGWDACPVIRRVGGMRCCRAFGATSGGQGPQRLARRWSRVIQRELGAGWATGPRLGGLAEQIAAASLWSSLGWLPRLTQETLVITGTADALVPAANASILAARMPRAQIHRVHGGGHLCLLDRAAEVGPVVSAFLGSLERTAINEVAELG